MLGAHDRRAALRLLGIGTAALAGMGHTPYRQWQVYRQKHLLIGTQKADPGSYPLGQAIARQLVERLPESRARVTRGPDARRLASLLTTGQLDLILLEAGEVGALSGGEPPFGDYGPIELRTLAVFDGYRLVTRPDFPAHHAWQIAQALRQDPADLPATGPAPAHPGVAAYHAGGPMPEPPAAAPLDADHAH